MMKKSVSLCTTLTILCCVLHATEAVDCYTCNVDFRSQPFEQNNSCLFPVKDNERTTCSSASKYCQTHKSDQKLIYYDNERNYTLNFKRFCGQK